MMTRTECTVNVARHARRVERANQLGWLYEAQAPAAAPRRRLGWLASIGGRLRPAHRPRVEASA